MKDTIITELVKFKVLETTTEDQLIIKAGNMINNFQKKQDGYMDAELVKCVEGNNWYLIYHYENLEKIQVVGEKLRKSKEFEEFFPLIDQASISVEFFYQYKKW